MFLVGLGVLSAAAVFLGRKKIINKNRLNLPKRIKKTRYMLEKVDNSWQTVMSEKVDLLFEKKRVEQNKALNANNGSKKINGYEKDLNRNIGLSILGLGASTAGLLFYAPLFVASSAFVVYLTIPLYKSAYKAITEEKRVKLDLIGALYMTGALITGNVVLALVGELFYFINEKIIFLTKNRSRSDLINVFAQQPRSAWVLIDDTEIEIPFEQVKIGDIVVVNTGQTIPVDGVIIEGIASVDQQALTGEAQPAEKIQGDSVFSSTVVLAGRINIKVEKTGEATTTAQLSKIINDTTHHQMAIEANSLQIAHRTALPTMLLSGIAFPLVGTSGAIALLMGNFGLNIKITSPITMLNFLRMASEKGILIKDGRSLESLASIDTVLFDKTGTLTLEQPEVGRICSCLETINEEQLLAYTAAAEGRHTHPIAKSIVAAATERQLVLPEVDDTQYELGYGIKVTIENQLVRVGSTRFMMLEGIDIPTEIEALQADCHEQGHSIIMIAIGEQLAGAIELQPTIRPEAKQIISELKQRNIALYIVSGDQKQPTEKLAKKLGIEHYFANTLPEEKAALVERLQQEGKSVCFVGDGINDAIALKKANVSVSLSGATSAATDTAQVVFMDGSLKKLPELFALAHDLESNTKAGFALASIPSAAVIGGVFFLHFGLAITLAVHSLGLTANMGLAMNPFGKAKEKKEEVTIKTLSSK